MSDETQANPKIGMVALREKTERLRREYDAGQAARDQSDLREVLDAITSEATRHLEAFGALPCKGEIARVAACTDEIACACPRRLEPSCPRNIIADDAKRHTESERERLKLSGVPGDVRRVLTTCFEPTECTQAVDSWLASGKRLLLLAGTFGTGKSVAAGYAIQRRPGRWMHASEIAKAAQFHHEDRMAELRAARLLVIDDLGSEFNDASGWGRAALASLLLTRYEDGLATVMTTNLDGKTWKAYADPRILDRLAGDGMVFGAVGKSRRRA